MPLVVKDQNGNTTDLAPSAIAIGVGTPPEGGQGMPQIDRTPDIFIDVHSPNWVEGDDEQLHVGDLILNSRNGGSCEVEADHQRGSNGNLGLGARGLIFFYTQDSPQGSSVKAAFANNGNVGIGIGLRPPQEKLEVDGNIIATGTAFLGEASLGGNGANGEVVVRDASGERILVLQGGTGDLKIGGHGKDGDITLFPREATDISTPAQAKIHLDGQAGDIRLLNADAAEEFDVFTDGTPEPGDVMVLGKDGQVCLCNDAYDRRVAGVVSGAGGHRPGIVFGHDNSRTNRVQLALMGRAYCKVNANVGPIEVGDLLTTSSLPGHAMSVREQDRAFGAVLGKAMGRLESGTGLIEVLVALQ